MFHASRESGETLRDTGIQLRKPVLYPPELQGQLRAESAAGRVGRGGRKAGGAARVYADRDNFSSPPMA